MSLSPTIASGRYPLWVAVLGGIVFWLVHLTAEAALVGPACHHRDVRWVMHAVTAATGAATVIAMAACFRIVLRARGADGGDDSPTVAGRTLFLGLFGLLTGAISLALIVLEGAYVVFLNPCS
ncbi:MAG: hypothetical protein E6G27_06305 [Actinobacteria bacterium]|nr:MAG: hypothetical protein E6G27_06305 [Actinomycetota bacterium]